MGWPISQHYLNGTLAVYNAEPMLEAARGLCPPTRANKLKVGPTSDILSSNPEADPESLSDRKAVWQEEK